MTFAYDGDYGLQLIVLEQDFLFVGPALLRNKREHKLFCLAYFKYALVFVYSKSVRRLHMPLGGLFSNVSYHDRFFGCVLDWNESKIELIGEVEHGPATDCPDWHDELLAFSHDH